MSQVNYLFFSVIALASLVTPLGNGTYKLPENWTGCFVNPDDLNDTTFGCSGPAGGPDSENLGEASSIIINLKNGSQMTLQFNDSEISSQKTCSIPPRNPNTNFSLAPEGCP
jgi:hypothetical protein